MSEPIVYFDRYSNTQCEEVIYGERFLRWAYESSVGRLTTEAFVKRAFFSKLYGWWVSRPASRSEVPRFVERFGLDPGDFVKSVDDFDSFNDFFYRKLKPEVRPIDADSNSVVFPADGRHLGYADMSEIDHIYAKGQRLELVEFLGDSELADRYQNGALVISRLCPVDYHRFHFPVAGVPSKTTLIDGDLYSVSPIALRRRIQYLLENKRTITQLETDSFGDVLLVEIGATNVGSIQQTYASGESVTKGAEKGFFAFGGSMTATVFEPGRVTLADDLLAQTAAGCELYARMGDVMGRG